MPYVNGYFVMDNSHYTNSHFHIPTYNKLQAPPKPVMHPNLAAAELGLTPKELAPILQECENPQIAFAQPPLILTRTTTNHPIPPTEQLGLTAEEVEELLEDQREWMREEEQRHKEGVETQHPTETHHHQGEQNDDTDT
ncbi:hypothetical protein PILCRDRAFT_12291 [Piloderma croceum F 1598]|uniref:Uncharacterized protein n=1 Tax=Piloderma croceum (strain F 1598) TaxID=765440 RepID=A0A0C3AT72_PILCF|nr:hypothetical protein PILCRDRAFT_12291 [Piloderma croceum F 1598]